MKSIKRIFTMNLPSDKSAFLWGPRKVGKSYWLSKHFKDSIVIDFLKTDVFADYISRPALLRERYASSNKRIIVDEVQMVPDILNEVHWLIENTSLSFLLSGSSPRKLRQHHANLLGGRAWRYTMHPLCYPELTHIDFEKIMISGLLPAHYLSIDPIQELRSYIADYLKEEIAAEAVVQNIPAFSEFLKVAALTTGELLNYTNVARESGVSAKVVRSYFQILEDTLLGFRLAPWKRAIDRRLIETEKFYLFDVGVTNYLARRTPKIGTSEFGKSFEHYILMELIAYKAYKNPELDIRYWRTSTGLEVDFILNDMEVAIEIKTAKRVHETDATALKILQSEHHVKQCIIVSFETEPKIICNHIHCLPWKHFLEKLWSGELI
ncbi:MAG: hypothetical protein A3E82_00085 [Gammaproteobacteria bacterium RIFCSPHIGHO2_12_FULL_38_11]|nr:MAG: hypothetical protein A3E82_00085 [Gammaproteobacteria bacterium RIFCSPHIGHO2_12_FULL_38_11]